MRRTRWEIVGGNRRFDVARYRRRALKPNDGPLGEWNGAFRGPASSRVPATSPIEKKAGCNPDGNSAARGVPCDTHRLARGNTVTRHTTTSREARRRHHTSARRRHFVLVSGTKVIANPMLENLKSRGLIFLVRRDLGMSRVWLHGQDRRESVRALPQIVKSTHGSQLHGDFAPFLSERSFGNLCASARHPHPRLSRSI